MGFLRTNRQHTITSRISAYEEELHFFLKFFDVKSFIMAVMMTDGIWLRSSGVAPDWFISFFYTGLGTSLLLAGLLFACNFAKAAIVTTEVCNAAARHRAAQLGIAVIDLEELKTGQIVHRLKVIMKAE